MSEEGFVPWSERGDDDNVDALIAMMAGAVNNEINTEGSDIAGDIVDNVLKSKGQDIGILGNFVLIGEIIGEDGDASLMVVTSDKLPEWIARGMLMVADEFISGGPPFLDGGEA